jgi:cytochrome b
MSDSQYVQPGVAQVDVRPAATKVLVWDRFVRFFHWSLVISFVLAYWSAKAGKHELHAVLGYFVVVLVLARLFWGLYGSRYARFSNFIQAPAAVLNYLKAIASGHPRRYLGHNPAGGIMVMALLATLVFITFTGLTVLAVIDFDGPLLGVMKTLTDQEAYAAWSSHAYAVNIVLAMVGLHLLGVILACFQHKENLVRAMVTGLKDSDAETDTGPASQPETAGRQATVYSTLAEGNETI